LDYFNLETLDQLPTLEEIQEIADANHALELEDKSEEGDFDFTFMRTFEDLLVAGEEIMYCGVLGGNPVMRRVNPMNVYTLGGNSMYIEDADIIVEYGYKSVGQVIDDYWVTSSNDMNVTFNQNFLYNSAKLDSSPNNYFITSQSFSIQNGVEYTLDANIPVFQFQGLNVLTLPNCETETGSLNLSSNHGPLSEIIIVAAPSAFANCSANSDCISASRSKTESSRSCSEMSTRA